MKTRVVAIMMTSVTTMIGWIANANVLTSSWTVNGTISEKRPIASAYETIRPRTFFSMPTTSVSRARVSQVSCLLGRTPVLSRWSMTKSYGRLPLLSRSIRDRHRARLALRPRADRPLIIGQRFLIIGLRADELALGVHGIPLAEIDEQHACRAHAESEAFALFQRLGHLPGLPRRVNALASPIDGGQRVVHVHDDLLLAVLLDHHEPVGFTLGLEDLAFRAPLHERHAHLKPELVAETEHKLLGVPSRCGFRIEAGQQAILRQCEIDVVDLRFDRHFTHFRPILPRAQLVRDDGIRGWRLNLLGEVGR